MAKTESNKGITYKIIETTTDKEKDLTITISGDNLKESFEYLKEVLDLHNNNKSNFKNKEKFNVIDVV